MKKPFNNLSNRMRKVHLQITPDEIENVSVYNWDDYVIKWKKCELKVKTNSEEIVVFFSKVKRVVFVQKPNKVAERRGGPEVIVDSSRGSVAEGVWGERCVGWKQEEAWVDLYAPRLRKSPERKEIASNPLAERDFCEPFTNWAPGTGYVSLGTRYRVGPGGSGAIFKRRNKRRGTG